MALDSLMYEEEVEMPACCEGKMCEGDTEPFASLLHFADHCLYRIVRWARNLPDFSTVAVRELYCTQLFFSLIYSGCEGC